MGVELYFKLHKGEFDSLIVLIVSFGGVTHVFHHDSNPTHEIDIVWPVGTRSYIRLDEIGDNLIGIYMPDKTFEGDDRACWDTIRKRFDPFRD
jgi:hypothetical protein